MEYWTCLCTDKRNANGVRKCRVCGQKKPKIKLDGDHIVVERQTDEPMFESTIKYLEDDDGE